MLLHRAPATLIATITCLVANLSAAAAGAATTSTGAITFPAATAATVQNPHTRSFTVMRTGGSSGAASATCTAVNGTAVAGKDFTLVNSTVQWANGDAAPKGCSVTIIDAVPYSGAKTFSLQLSKPVGATMGSMGKTVVTIYGNKGGGTVTVGASTYAVSQNAGIANVIVNRTGGSVGAAVVQYATANQTAVAGTDYTAVHGQFYWANGDATPRTIQIPIMNAKPFSGTKALAVAIAAPENVVLGAQTSAILTVKGDAATTPPVTTPPPPTTGQVSRPAYNTGNGFFVLNGKLYDANGNEFRIRGVDRCHYDSDSAAGIAKSGANAVRMFMYGLSVGAPKYVSILQTQHIAYGEVPIPSVPLFPDGTTTSGNQSTSELAAGVAWWVANAATFAPISKYLIINIANEWGPSNSTTWRDAYISAIASLRAAGYLGPLMIDSGGWGQDTGDLLNYSTAVFNSDPQKNIIFSLHIYGSIPTASVAPDLAALAALSASVGMVFVVGEFGPGRDIGPSPTETTPADIITAAEANGIGWIGWAWDDNDLGNGASNDNWFSMTYAGPGIYTQTSDLTTFGQDIVLNPTYGLQVLAKKATIF